MIKSKFKIEHRANESGFHKYLENLTINNTQR